MSGSIIVDGVSKKFRLQADRATSVKELFTRRGRDKTLDEHWALKDVSLEIEEGSMYALIGHNGSGKSTLLRCIAGIYQPDEGNVKVSGRISTLLELGAGFHPDLSGRENIYMNATMLGMSKSEIDTVFDDIVSFAGGEISRFLDSPVKVYSTGMYVRLGFSVAVHVKPEILIIDEVIAVGDEQFQRRCFEHLYSLRRQGVTIVVVTHGMGTVQTMCDRAAWLERGVLQLEGPAPQVTMEYLRRVNRREAEAAEELTAVADVDSSAEVDDEREHIEVQSERRPSITELGEHWGSGEVRITKVEFFGADGATDDVIIAGAPFTIRISYDATEAIENPTFGIAIHRDGGLHVTGTNTRLSKREMGVVDGPGVVEFSTEHLPILDGGYLVSVAVEDEHSQHTFDRYDYGWHLNVRYQGEQVIHGLVDIGGSWKLPSDED